MFQSSLLNAIWQQVWPFPGVFRTTTLATVKWTDAKEGHGHRDCNAIASTHSPAQPLTLMVISGDAQFHPTRVSRLVTPTKPPLSPQSILTPTHSQIPPTLSADCMCPLPNAHLEQTSMRSISITTTSFGDLWENVSANAFFTFSGRCRSELIKSTPSSATLPSCHR